MSRLITIREASETLSVSTKTLRRWDDTGVLVAIKTNGGHRRYLQDDIDKFMKIYVPKQENGNKNVVATYSRVSSHEQKQKGDLNRQSVRLSEYCAKKKMFVEYIIKDVGSGLNDTRVGLNKLINLVIGKKINKTIIEHKDRLTRFQYNLIEKFFNSYGVEIIHVEKNDISEQEDLVTDMVSLMASFSGKLYGKRSAKRRKEAKEEKIN